MKPQQFTHVFWDFNGTILDDTALCLNIINTLLSKKQLPPLTLERYREVFDFPVIRYYEKVGFDFSKDCWETVSLDFIQSYQADMHNCSLHKGVPELLMHLKNNQITCAVLSAMQENALVHLLNTHELQDYFVSINGLQDHYANSKTHLGEALIQKLNCNPEQVLMIGDTAHDADVAKSLGIQCALTSAGHQSHARLEKTGYPVFKDMTELYQRFCS
jgi:phosphoglycolate phosphatase